MKNLTSFTNKINIDFKKLHVPFSEFKHLKFFCWWLLCMLYYYWIIIPIRIHFFYLFNIFLDWTFWHYHIWLISVTILALINEIYKLVMTVGFTAWWLAQPTGLEWYWFISMVQEKIGEMKNIFAFSLTWKVGKKLRSHNIKTLQQQTQLLTCFLKLSPLGQTSAHSTQT